ncbi:MAG TPA: O-antigen ligase family protein [Kofleriaceae bacterium]|nr:O-antigen ligase family protein [Kofleriaceae bacterium]
MILRAAAAVALVGGLLWGGATRPPATLTLAVVGAVALIAALVEQHRREERVVFPPLAVPLAALTAATLLQLVPLPAGLRAWLNPEGERVTELVLRGIAHAGWRPLTADVAATLNDAAKLAGLTALAIALGQMGEGRRREWLRHAVLIALAAVLAVAVLSQLGIPLPPPLVPAVHTRALTGFPFVNPNHAAALLALVLPTVLAQAARRSGTGFALMLALLALGNAALAATVSRGGIVIGLAAQAVTLWLVVREKEPGARRVMAWGALILVAGLGLAVAPLLLRLRSGGQGWLPSATRWRMVVDALAVVRDFPLSGVGRGAFGFVFGRYSPLAARHHFAFVENQYLQVVLDYGIPVTIAIALACVLAWRRTGGLFKERSIGARAALVGLAALALHNVVDFSWESGGIAACACALGALAFPSVGPPLGRAPALVLAGVVLALVALAASPLGRTADVDAARLRTGMTGTVAGFTVLATDAQRRHPADGLLADLTAGHLLYLRDPAAFEWIDRALLLGPHDVAAHRLAARGLVAARLPSQAALEFHVALAEASDQDRGPIYGELLALLSREEDAEHLFAALPHRPDILRVMVIQLCDRKRWALAERVGRAALELSPDDPVILRTLLRGALESGAQAGPDVPERARRLARLDVSSDGALLAGRALALAGDLPASEQILTAQFRRGGYTLELVFELQKRIADRGNARGAAAILDEALAAATSARDKARLHAARADLEERAGNVHRAAAERAEAARLGREAQ